MKKKITAIILTTIMTLCSFNTFAEEQLSTEIKTAILNAKSIITIDEEYDDFSYEIDNYTGQAFYSLCWTNDANNSIKINITKDNEILLYENESVIYSNDNSSSGLKDNLSKSEAQAYAESFIKKVIPERVSELSLTDVKIDSNTFTFYYGMKINDIPVAYDDVFVTVSKQTGEIYHFFNNGSFLKNNINKNISNLIDLETAKEKYIEDDGVKLSYIVNYDYKTKKATLIPTYVVINKAISAKNGAEVFIDNNSSYIGSAQSNAATEDASADFAYNKELTESELASLIDLNQFISEEKAKEIITKYKLNFDIENIEKGSLIKSSTNNSVYYWSFSCPDGHFKVDAKTGGLEGFYRYDHETKDSKAENKSKPALSENQAKDKIYNYLKLFANDKLKELSSENIYYSEYKNNYSIAYNRKINNIATSSNYISISIDGDTGELQSFNKHWYNDIEVISKPIKLSAKDAFNIYADKAEFRLCYNMIYKDLDNNDEYYIEPIYTAKNNDIYYIDVENGNRLTYNGEIYKVKITNTGYTDISGNKYEKEINILLENNYYFSDSEFRPNDDMTVKSFLELMQNKKYSFSDVKLEQLAEKIGLKTDEPISRLACAKIIVYYTEQSQLAEIDEIFADLYNDVAFKDKAEVAIMTAVVGNSLSEEFKPDEILSRGEGAYYVYCLLNYIL